MLSDLTRDCTVYFQNFLVEIVVNETLSYVLSYPRKNYLSELWLCRRRAASRRLQAVEGSSLLELREVRSFAKQKSIMLETGRG
jgi:hypothetical protein